MSDHIENDIYGEEVDTQRVTAADAAAGKGPATKMDNISALGKNPKTSRVILATTGLVVLAGGIALVSILSKNSQSAEQPSAAMTGASVGAPPSSLTEKTNSALANSEHYKDIVAGVDAQRASEARSNGESSQPLSSTVENSFKNMPAPGESALKQSDADKARIAAEQEEAKRLAALATVQTQPSQHSGAQNGNQQQDPLYQVQMSNAQMMLSALIANRPRAMAIVSMADQNAQSSGVGQQGGQQAFVQGGAPRTGSVGQQSQGQTAAATQFTLIGAGQIESARIDTGMNTDLSGDFGATLLTGRFAGAKLIGSYTRAGELVVGTVRLLSMPAQGVSVPATAVILDAETSEGGTASDVDRKLLVKYGIKPLAAGFAAIADVLKNAGTSVVVNGATVSTTQPEMTGKRAAQIVAGSAAQQVNSDADALNTTPTVRVKRGSIVGIFFTQDVLYTPNR